MKIQRARRIAWAVVILWMVLIFSLSAQTARESATLSSHTIGRVAGLVVPGFADLSPEQQTSIISGVQDYIRKVAHVILYLVLGGLCMTALFQHPMKMPVRFIAALAIGMGYGATDELHQLFVVGRGRRSGMSALIPVVWC